jgi:hypothetical protein
VDLEVDYQLYSELSRQRFREANLCLMGQPECDWGGGGGVKSFLPGFAFAKKSLVVQRTINRYFLIVLFLNNQLSYC